MPDRKLRSEPADGAHPPQKTKICAVCGRSIAWRKKWERDWDEVRFCSDACRAHKPSAQDRALESAILALLKARGRDKRSARRKPHERLQRATSARFGSR